MAMLKNKNMAFSLILMCLVVVSPMANAQLPGLGGILGLLNIVRIDGLVSCSLNGSVSTSNATSLPPPFPNATVAIQCLGQTVGTGTTNTAGIVSLNGLLTSIPLLLSNGCRAVLTTPLSSCNASLPNVNLTAPITLVGTTFNEGINIITFIIGAFNRILA
ncbi:unnamed protein product [Thlaspi arvense]|uniref:Phylloplanin n=1 Tax=Thlaspi arvense TaxID=13288 RepID=A0AAU9RYK7_THLAR|nr:unnamed protein product [Thlaspi arvense]